MSELTLEQVVNEFTLWRSNRTNRSYPTPSYLWRSAAQLAGRYNQTAICKALSISGSQFKEKVIPIIQERQFVTAKPATQVLPDAAQLTVSSENRSLQIQIPTHQLATILPLIIKPL